MSLPYTILTGRLVADPTLRYVGDKSTPALQFRVACTKRAQDPNTKEWKDVAECFLTVQAWRSTAENAAVSLTRGTLVDVKGFQRQREYTTENGEKRTVYEIIDAEVAINLSNQSAEVTRTRSTPTSATPPAQAGTAPPATGAPEGFQPAF